MSSGGWKYVNCPHEGKWRGIVTGPGTKMLSTNCFESQQDAARAADKLVYKVKGPDASTNYPLTAEQKARLDSIPLEQLLAEFRAAGQSNVSSGSSKHRGVSWNATSSKWQVHTSTPSGQRVRLGHFADENAAGSAYDAAAWRLHGSYAKLNFPSKYINLPPGQDPPSIEDQIPEQSARDRLEAAARGNKSSASGGLEQKRKPAQTKPVPRKKAAGAFSYSDAVSRDIGTLDGGNVDGDGDFFQPLHMLAHAAFGTTQAAATSPSSPAPAEPLPLQPHQTLYHTAFRTVAVATGPRCPVISPVIAEPLPLQRNPRAQQELARAASPSTFDAASSQSDPDPTEPSSPAAEPLPQQDLSHVQQPPPHLTLFERKETNVNDGHRAIEKAFAAKLAAEASVEKGHQKFLKVQEELKKLEKDALTARREYVRALRAQLCNFNEGNELGFVYEGID